jgi:uncharacterized protein (TIGR00255 family)
MTLSSMTGFSRAEGRGKGVRWVWEVRSVNGKGLDVRCRLPQGLEVLEADVRARAQSRFSRGNIQVTLELEREGGEDVIRVNEAALDRVLSIAKELRRRHKLPPPSIEGLLALRGVLETGTTAEDAKVVAARNERMLKSLEDCFENLSKSRRGEGGKLKDILEAQISRIEELIRAARDNPARSPEIVRARLKEQVDRLLETTGELDPSRLHQEAVLLATRSDIQEEIDRLGAHVEAARDLLAVGEPVGRKFEFLAQEFNREANTLCSKAQDRSLTEIGLNLKATIDQMREQVQNVE